MLGLFYLKSVYLAVFAILPWDVPDEIGHLGYIQHIAEGEGYPVFWETRMDEEMWRSMAGPQGPPADYNWIAQHPPLYYTMMVPAYWIGSLFSDSFEGPLYAVRVVSALLMVIALQLIYRLAKRFNESEVMALCLVAMASSIPLIGQTAAGVNNDTLIVLLSVSLAFQWLRFGQTPTTKNLLMVGVVIGLCGITKYTMLLVMAPVTTLVLWRFVQERGVQVKGILGFVSLGWLPLVAWSVRNMLVTGKMMPTALDHLSFDSSTHYSLFEFFRAYPYFTHTFRSFWGIWGWHGVGQDLELNTLHLPASHQFIYATLLGLLAVISLLVLFSRLRMKDRSSFKLAAAVSALVVVLVYLQALFPHESYYVIWLLYLTAVSACWVIVAGVRGLWFTAEPKYGWRSRIQMESILVGVFFLAVIVRQMHDYSNEGGALRGTHGRYFFAVMGLLLVAWVLPALRCLRPRSYLVVMAAGLMVLAELWLLLDEVIPYLNRNV